MFNKAMIRHVPVMSAIERISPKCPTALIQRVQTINSKPAEDEIFDNALCDDYITMAKIENEINNNMADYAVGVATHGTSGRSKISFLSIYNNVIEQTEQR